MPRQGKRGRPRGSKNKFNKFVIRQKIKKEKFVDENVCKFCKKSCSVEEFEGHVDICRGINSSQHRVCCKECGKSFKFMKSYLQHKELNHSTLPDSVCCPHCDVKCPNDVILKEHLESVHDRAMFACPECNKTFVRRSHVTRHMTQTGCHGLQKSLHRCGICSAKFTRKDNLMVHLRSQHIQRSSKAFQCKSCPFETKNLSKLINHWHLKHSGKPNYYECHHCGKSTSSRAAIAKHLEIHGAKKYSCDVCGYATFTVEVMRRHVLTHIADKPYKCHRCNRSFIQKSQLQRHMEKYDKSNICTKCGECFSSRCQLSEHATVHEAKHDKLFCRYESCEMSEKIFKTEVQLQKHVASHFEERPYACDVCGKQFAVETHMRRHLSTHTLDRPRRCMYCVSARAYVRGEQLVKHVRVHHPAAFHAHLKHVRTVLGTAVNTERVKRSELESVLNLLDAESDRIMDGYGGTGVLYGGMQEFKEDGNASDNSTSTVQNENSTVMTEDELSSNLEKMLCKLIDAETLEFFGWPKEPIDVILEKVIEQCGAKPADRAAWTRVQRLRENAKYLFLYVIDDKNIARMLDTHTIDQIVKHIIEQVSDTD